MLLCVQIFDGIAKGEACIHYWVLTKAPTALGFKTMPTHMEGYEMMEEAQGNGNDALFSDDFLGAMIGENQTKNDSYIPNFGVSEADFF